MAESIGSYSAAFAYYLSMTLFPMVIILYFLLGKQSDTILQLMESAKVLIPLELVDECEEFISHLSQEYSPMMLLFAISTIVLSSSAGCTMVVKTIGKMQGQQRFSAKESFIGGLFMSLLIILVVYLIIIVLLLGRTILGVISRYFPVEFEYTNGVVTLLIIYTLIAGLLAGLYLFCRPKNDQYSVIAGSMIAALFFTVNSALFSWLVSGSVKYQLLYGAMASIILMLYYLYTCGMTVYIGAIINIAIRDVRASRALVCTENPKDSADCK